MAKEVDQYILRVEGEEELKQLEKQIDAARAALVQSINASGAASTAARQQAAALGQLENRYNTLARSVDKLNLSTNRGSRARAISQLGFGGINALQDIIQAGPAAAANNVIFLAQQDAIRGLGAEAIAAGGGIGVLGAAFSAVAVTAGAAFLVINHELKKAQLGWEDFGTVVANTAPWLALQEAATGAAQAIGQLPWDAAIVGAQSAAGYFLVDLSKMAVGWDDATEAARRHKEETAEAAREAKELAAATARLNQYQSEAQKKQAAKGAAIGVALAEMGGAGGIPAVQAKLGGGKGVVSLMDRAARGDAAAIAQLRPMLAGRGFGMEAYDVAATEGIDLKAQNEEVRRNQLKGEREARRYKEGLDRKSNEEDARRMKEGEANLQAFREEQAQKAEQRRATAAGNLQGGFARDVLFGGKATKTDIARRLMESQGFTGEEAAAAAGDVLGKLQKGFTESMRKRAGEEGITLEEAMTREREDVRQKMADEALSLADAQLGAMEQAQQMQAMRFGKAPERIATEDFARAVEQGGQDVQKDQLAQLKEIKEAIETQNDLMKSTRQIARLAR